MTEDVVIMTIDFPAPAQEAAQDFRLHLSHSLQFNEVWKLNICTSNSF